MLSCLLAGLALAKSAQLSQAAGFTGKRVYHVYAKTWINIGDITERSWLARKIHILGNTQPTDATSTQGFDYKLYQSFGVEVEFVDGRVVRHTFVDDLKLAGRTLGLPGEVDGPAPSSNVSNNGMTLEVTRRIEGNPHMFIKAGDIAVAETVLRSWGLDLRATKSKRIHNTLRLRIKGLSRGLLNLSK